MAETRERDMLAQRLYDARQQILGCFEAEADAILEAARQIADERYEAHARERINKLETLIGHVVERKLAALRERVERLEKDVRKLVDMAEREYEGQRVAAPTSSGPAGKEGDPRETEDGDDARDTAGSHPEKLPRPSPAGAAAPQEGHDCAEDSWEDCQYSEAARPDAEAPPPREASHRTLAKAVQVLRDGKNPLEADTTFVERIVAAAGSIPVAEVKDVLRYADHQRDYRAKFFDLRNALTKLVADAEKGVGT